MIKDENLFKEYAVLKATILNIMESKSIEYLDKNMQKVFILQYREFLLNSTHGIYPLFIFSKYDEDKFKKCLDYLNEGHTLIETDNYFISDFKENKAK